MRSGGLAMSHPERVIGVLGAIAAGLATLRPQGWPWVSALLAAGTVTAGWLVWRTRRGGRGAGGPPTFAIWGRWKGPRWMHLRDGLRQAMGQAGFVPARGRTAPDMLICGPGAPRLAGWTPHRVATYVVGIVPRHGGGQPERWTAALLGRLAWDAVAYVDLEGERPEATVVDLHAESTSVTGRADRQAFGRALARLLVAHARGGDAGVAGF